MCAANAGTVGLLQDLIHFLCIALRAKKCNSSKNECQDPERGPRSQAASLPKLDWDYYSAHFELADYYESWRIILSLNLLSEFDYIKLSEFKQTKLRLPTLQRSVVPSRFSSVRLQLSCNFL